MVSIPFFSPSSTIIPISHKLSFLPATPPFPAPFHRARRGFSLAAVGTSPNPNSPLSQQSQNQQQQQVRTLFPGGFKRAEIKVPTIVLSIAAEAVLGNDTAQASIEAALSRGIVGIVLLTAGDGASSGGTIYEAACLLKSLIRERAYLVIDERVDIAAAVGANGVLLSDRGIPAIVARSMMSKSTSESVLLPLVSRNVESVEDVASASRVEGADFIVISTKVENCSKSLESFVLVKDDKIPVFLRVSGIVGNLSSLASEVLQAGASGLVLFMDDLELCGGDDDFDDLFNSVSMVDIEVPSDQSTSDMGISNAENGSYDTRLVAGFTKLANEEIQLIGEERNALLEAVAVMQKAVPLMKEVSLLVDAIAQLDQPFLLAVVGEFNSGKSSVINALLGRRCLGVGVVPTTNEITFLCYSDTEAVEPERCERHPDGQLICYLPAPILQEMNIVDTPGTNVILQRQQSLTEEFIPRADLVLFVLSSDRPLSESEVTFLRYIRQWRKNILFVLNKSDLYRSASELQEAVVFVKDNVGKLISTNNVKLFPVSARLALEAKLSTLPYVGENANEHLTQNLCWISSGFPELEEFLFSFLDGSTDTGFERMRLKLETPIAIADRILAASEKLIQQEIELACKDLIVVNDIINSVREYASRLENESASWRRQALSLVQAAKARSRKLVKSILQLSNVDLIITYALRAEKSSSSPATSSMQNDIISPALSEIQMLLEEYFQWLQSSVSQECQKYIESFDKRWPGSLGDDNQALKYTDASLDKQTNLSMQAINNFSAGAASRLFEQEIREVALGTYGGLGAAGLSASLLTSVLPTTLEDLLALGLCSAGGLLAISNFPARRKRVIKKVERVADGLAQQIEEAMEGELSRTIEKLEIFVESIAKPYKEASQGNIDRLSELKKEMAITEKKLLVVRTRIQNLGGS